MAERLIFASYNRQDHQKVEDIARGLESWGIKLWVDTERLTPGTFWGRNLDVALEKADAAVVFHGAEIGRWQRWEINLLLRRTVEEKLSVLIPVLIEGAGDEIQGLLGNIQRVDLRGSGNRNLHILATLLRRQGDVERARASAAEALFRIIVNEATDPDEVKGYADQCVEAKKWPQALYACSRLQAIALDTFNAHLFADSCGKSAQVYALWGRKEDAKRQWAIGLAIYRNYATKAHVAAYEERFHGLDFGSPASTVDMQPASRQL
jgi:hypothetical protein